MTNPEILAQKITNLKEAAKTKKIYVPATNPRVEIYIHHYH
jgi:hypothetical protein